MTVKFEIEQILKISSKAECYIFAKCLDLEKDFQITEHSLLGSVEISKYLTQPRALTKEGKPRYDLFTFRLKYKKDYEKLKIGEIVELTNEC